MAENTEKVQDLEGEVWKDLQGYEGLYQISNKGRVKSSKTLITKNHETSERLLNPKPGCTNHLYVNLNKNGITKKSQLHILVGKHFVANPECLDLVKHIDGNVQNNRASNLQRYSGKTEDLSGEEWREVKGYEGFYHVSNLGRVKKLKRDVYTKNGNFFRTDPEKLNKIHVNRKRGNYYTTDLVVKGQRRTFQIHRLLAINFIPNPDNKKYVNHIDHNPMNNSLENLEWVNQMENSCHAQKRIKRTSKYIGVGWDKYAGKWKCQIYHKKKSIHIGSFASEEEAYEARKRFEQENGISNKYV